jgi:hypothetical protein
MAKTRRGEVGLSNEEMRELARLHSNAAFETIVSVMNDRRYPKNRLAAAQMILDRAYGKAATVNEGPPVEHHHSIEVRWKLPERSEPILLEAKRVINDSESE